MPKYKITVPILVEAFIVIEADDECDAHDKYEQIDFEIEESYGTGGASFAPVNEKVSMCVLGINYGNSEINEVEK